MYDYTDYRVLNDGIKICNSADNYVENIWKVRNKPIRTTWLYRKYYTVNKQFTVYSASDGHYLRRNEYWVTDAKLTICKEKLRPTSSQYTQKDLLMCNNSMINIKHDDEFKVLTDLSILFKSTVYDYTEYRVLNDGIKICNSTNNYVRNIWKLRNKWVKAGMHKKSCNKPIRTSWVYRKNYTVN